MPRVCVPTTRHLPVTRTPRPEAVIFDNDGLLLDTEEAWTRAERTLFARRGRVFTIEHKRSLIGSARPAAALKLEAMLELAGQGGELIDELHELVMEEALAGVAPRPGALELIERLAGGGVGLGVASNSRREFVERTLESAGLLRGPFATIVSVEDVERPKPAPDIYVEACRRLGARPDASVALEDSPTGVAAAAAAGMYVIGVPYFEDGELPGSDLTARSLADPAVAQALGLAGKES
ncbi:MAG TPA: HAD family phosphatase [Solirubrobacteraceae bacterium]|nr:HAD family phosphatase [Solirubrobacteraceae bacterium]